MVTQYIDIFKEVSQVKQSAPARANLIGEHTDYNNGYVFPFPLSCNITIEASINTSLEENTIQLSSSLYKNKIDVRSITDKPQNKWTDYIIGSIISFAEFSKVKIKPMNIFADGNVPIGAGVSSSAALEVATIRAMCKLYDVEISAENIALLARKAENEFVGMPCGIMDQFVSSVGKIGHGLFLDCKDLSYNHIELPKEYEFVVVPSGVEHELVDGAYAKLVQQCSEACKLLNVESLRELTIDDMDKINSLPEVIKKRARHVITENDRVLKAYKALQNKDINKLGELLYQSHLSQKNDYEITVPETDKMVEDALKLGAIGARQTGGGFGGSLVIILKSGAKEKWWEQMQKLHPNASLV